MIKIDTPESLRLLHEAVSLAHRLAVTLLSNRVGLGISGALEDALDQIETQGTAFGVTWDSEEHD